MKNKLNTNYEMNKQERIWLENKMNWKYINKSEEKEEIDIFIRQIIDKLQLMEKPIMYKIHNVKIENKRDFMKRILSLTYLNESQLQKLRNIKTEKQLLNQSMDNFFKLINFKAKLKEQNWYHEWLWEEYLRYTREEKEENKNKTENTSQELINILNSIDENITKMKENSETINIVKI